MSKADYWKECIAEAAAECDLKLTPDQLDCLACGAEGGHEHYGMAFYSPPWSDRLSVIESEAADKLKRLQADFDKYRSNAETAVKRALRQYDDAHVTIGERGEVLRHDGRTDRIQ
jgi:hypothetical protein